MRETNYSEDYLLDGKVFIRQPEHGFRVGMDSVLLAASIEPDMNDYILDIGSGVGAASICLAQRFSHIKISGIELQRDLVRFAGDNVQLNYLRDRIEIIHGDLLRPPPRFSAGTYSQVMVNPPYFEFLRSNISPHQAKAYSNQESEATLEQWVKFCLLMVKPKGIVTFIYRVERLDELLYYFYGKLGSIQIYPLWPSVGKPAKLALIRGVKNTQGKTKLLSGLVLHLQNGSKYTMEAEDILRRGKGIEWSK